MHNLLTAQYESIKSARGVLFDYCGTISNADLFKSIIAFNDSSMVDLLVHNANTYRSWIANFGLDKGMRFNETGDVKNLDEIRSLFDGVNSLVDEFLRKYADDYEIQLTKLIAHKGITITATPLQLFTHVITHEFHHKGQVLTMSRILGHIPVDTDALRF